MVITCDQCICCVFHCTCAQRPYCDGSVWTHVLLFCASSQSLTHNEFGIQEAKVWCSRARFFLCLHHQTPPSHRPPFPPHLGYLRRNTGNVSFWEISSVSVQGKVVKHLAHHAGRNQGKDSESARSSRHTLSFLQSGWLRSGVGHPIPEAKRSQILQTNIKQEKSAECKMGVRIQRTASCSSCSNE